MPDLDIQDSTLLQSTPLLRTKLLIPQQPTGFITRKRLLDTLNQAHKSRLTLISAPAGFGKTSLLTEWIQGVDHSVAWLSLDNNDNDLTKFLMYLLTALQTINDEIGQVALNILRSTSNYSPDLILTETINDLTHHNELITLVLDDYQFITDETIHQFIAFLTENSPPSFCLVVSTRVDPPFPLPRLRARRQLTELRASDLRFTEQEINDFFVEIFENNLNKSDIIALEKRTEGWVAGLQIAALSMQSQDDISTFITSFTGSHRHILDYLLEEVFEKQTQDIQEFLVKTSITGQLFGDLCNILTETDNGQEILEYLHRANLFVIALDNERHCYRYHQLFADFLSNRLEQSGINRSNLHKRASAWFSNKDPIQAINHAFLSGDYDLAIQYLENQTQNLISKRIDIPQLLKWFNTLPHDLILNRPLASIAYARLLIVTSNTGSMPVYLDAAENQLDNNTNTVSPIDIGNMRGEIAILRAEIAMLNHDTESALNLAQQALDLISDNSTRLYNTAKQLQGYIYLSSGYVNKAAETLHSATRLTPIDDAIRIYTLTDYADALTKQGKFNLAFETFKEASQDGEISQHLLSTTQLGLGKLHYEKYELSQAKQHISDGLAIAQRANITRVVRYAHTLLAQVHFASGNIDRAFEELRIAEKLTYDDNVTGSFERVKAVEAHFHINLEQEANVHQWMDAQVFTPNDHIKYDKELEYFVFAEALCRRKRFDDAIIILDQITKTALSNGRISDVLENLILQADIYQKQNAHQNAKAILEQALNLNNEGQFLRIFVVNLDKIADLLTEIAQSGKHMDFIRLILDTAKNQNVKINAQITNQNYETLSERELDVLRLVALGMSNREIANQLIIGVSTVKTHLIKIYGKLDVHNRTEAVARAQSLRILTT